MNDELQNGVAGVAKLRFTTSSSRVNLVLVSLNVRGGFAGLTTALRAGALLAVKLKCPLRIMVLKRRPVDSAAIRSDTTEFLISMGLLTSVDSLEILYLDDLETTEVGYGDHWLVTFWMTAYAIARLVDNGSIADGSVTYLIQDFEPGFYAFGTEYALALSTYGADFNWLVNSTSLAGYLSELGYSFNRRRLAFAPAINKAEIEKSARGWRKDPDHVRVLFYGRPLHPRNMFDLGVEALRHWVQSCPDSVREKLIVSSIGSDHDEVDLGKGVTLRALGKLSLAEYYEQLSFADMGMALMLSPHPSHLALEMPMAGIPTLTNSFHRARVEWYPNLRVSNPTPEALAAGLNATFVDSTKLELHRFDQLPAQDLGRSLDEMISDLPIHWALDR
jgi:hypothetical protein